MAPNGLVMRLPIFMLVLLPVLFVVVFAMVGQKKKAAQAQGAGCMLAGLGLLVMFGLLSLSYVRTSSSVTHPPQMIHGPATMVAPPDTAMAPMPPMPPMPTIQTEATPPQIVWDQSQVRIASSAEDLGLVTPQQAQAHAGLVANETAWSGEVEALYQAKTFASADSAGRGLGRRIRRHLERLSAAEQPSKVVIVVPTGWKADGYADLCMPALEGLQSELQIGAAWAVAVTTDDGGDLWRFWRPIGADQAAQPTNTTAANVERIETAKPVAEVADDDAMEQLSTSEPSAATTATVTENTVPAPPEPSASDTPASAEGEELFAESNEGENLFAESNSEEAADEAADEAPAEAPADGVADAPPEVAHEAQAGEGAAESPAEAVASPLACLLRLELRNLNVLGAAAWDARRQAAHGEFAATLQTMPVGEAGPNPPTGSPTIQAQEQVRFDAKPWVEHEGAFRSERPGQQFVVVRSPFATAADEATGEVNRMLGSFVHSRLTMTGHINPAVINPDMLIHNPILAAVIKDRFLQELVGPDQHPIWREAALVDLQALEPNGPIVSWAQSQQQGWQVAERIHHERRRTFVGQLTLLMLGIVGVYGMLNAATQGYFQGRLRLLAVVAVAALVLTMFLLG